MATCAECGSENPDGSRFCGSCGKPLPAAEAAAPEEDVSSAPTTEQPAGCTPEHAAYNEALAAINAPSSAGTPPTEETAATTEQPPATAEQPAATTPVPAVPPGPPTTPQPAATSTMPPTVAASGGGGPNKKVLALVGGGVALLVILGAVWFFFIKDDSEPASDGIRLSDELQDEPSEEPAEEEVTDDASDAPIEGEEGPVFDSLETLLVDSAGPYSITQSSSDPCEPPCIFPDDAHLGAIETAQATWDAGGAESQIYGEFLLYETSTDAGAAFQTTASQLEASGYQPIGTVTIQGIDGTTYQSVENEVILYTVGNMMMGLVGNDGYPTEFVGYL